MSIKLQNHTHPKSPVGMNHLSSISSYKKYGVPRSEVLHAISSFPHISGIDQCLSEYYMLYCTPEHFSANQHAGVYYRDDRQYVIIYEQSLTRWFALHSKSQLILSFRSAKPEYDLPDYVLVSLSTSPVSSFAALNSTTL